MIVKLRSFLIETKKEVVKISWIKRKELLVSTLSVFVIIGLFSLFFLLVDVLVSNLITYILGVMN